MVIKQYALLSQLHLLTCVYGKRQVEHGTKNAWSGWISTHVASPGLAVIYLYAGLLDFFWKTLFMHHEVNITSCMFQHSPYGGNAVLSGTCQLIFTYTNYKTHFSTVEFTLILIPWHEHISCVCLCAHLLVSSMLSVDLIRESVDSRCRDGADAQYMQYLSKSRISWTNVKRCRDEAL